MRILENFRGCKFFAEVEDKTVEGKNIVFSNYWEKTECALLKKGDKIKLTKLIYSSGDITYKWNGRDTEILPGD